jgi:hypothetical protein
MEDANPHPRPAPGAPSPGRTGSGSFVFLFCLRDVSMSRPSLRASQLVARPLVPPTVLQGNMASVDAPKCGLNELLTGRDILHASIGQSELTGSDGTVVSWVTVRRSAAAKRQRHSLALEVENFGRGTVSFACSLLASTEPIHPSNSVNLLT